jgi:16S rRNA (guanine527-N7)-methyltransferase
MDFSIVSKYFPDLSQEQISKFNELGNLYQEWNEKINLISRKDMDHLYERHILHSLAIAKVISFKAQTTILDVGTGGGLPGIPLAILFPESNFHLVDSIGKKIMVVQDISQKLDLKNIKAEQIRAESVQDRYDFVISRAVTRLRPFYDWVRNKFLKGSFNDLENGIIYLKGGDLEEELKEVKGKKTIFNINDFFKEDFFDTKKVIYLPVK